MTDAATPNLFSSPSPHWRKPTTVPDIMRDVCIALLPAAVGSVYLFGPVVVPYYVLSIAMGIVCDYFCRKIRGRPYRFDYSPVVTGMLFAMSLPASAPLWFPVLGMAFAIIVAKELFGGLGRNFLNPAVAGRGFLRLLFVAEMTRNVWPRPEVPGQSVFDAISGATPLRLVKDGMSLTDDQLLASLFGTVGGKIGETSALLLLIGAVFLWRRKVIRLRIPLTTIIVIGIVAYCFGGPDGFLSADWRVAAGHMLGGATVLGAFFMATDYSSSPSDPRAQYIFAALLGVVTMLFRFYSEYPEGFTFALLIMNCTVPFFNRYMRPRVLGEQRS